MKCLLSILFLFIVNLANAQNLDIYVSDAGNFDKPPWKILKYNNEGKNPEIFIETKLNWPQDILFREESNTVMISNLGSNCITIHDATSGDFISYFAKFIAGPTRMKIGSDGLLYVLQWNGDGKVKRFQMDGSFVDDFTSVGVSQSIGMDWDKEGNLYVSSYGDKLVRKFDQQGKDMGIFINENLKGPTNIWFDDNEDLLIIDYNGKAVKRFDKNGAYLNNFIDVLPQSEGVEFLKNGNILIGNGKSSSVNLYDNSGKFLKEFITKNSGILKTPNAVVLRNN